MQLNREQACRLRLEGLPSKAYAAIHAPLLERAGPVGRLIIRYRISRFIQRRMDRLSPPEALYSSQRLPVSAEEPIHSGVSRDAVSNV